MNHSVLSRAKLARREARKGEWEKVGWRLRFDALNYSRLGEAGSAEASYPWEWQMTDSDELAAAIPVLKEIAELGVEAATDRLSEIEEILNCRAELSAL